MTQRDLTAEALQRGAAPGRGYVVARAISQILHPIFLGIVSILIVGFFALPSRAAGMGWALLCTIIQVVPPVAFFTLRLRQGAYTDEDVSVRQQRNELYLFGFANLLAGLGILALVGAPAPFMALILSAVMVNILSWLINIWWKISVHSASVGTCATLASLYSPPLAALLWAGAVTLGWARVRTRNHTPMQVVAGISLASACVLLSYAAFGLVALP